MVIHGRENETSSSFLNIELNFPVPSLTLSCLPCRKKEVSASENADALKHLNGRSSSLDIWTTMYAIMFKISGQGRMKRKRKERLVQINKIQSKLPPSQFPFLQGIASVQRMSPSFLPTHVPYEIVFLPQSKDVFVALAIKNIFCIYTVQMALLPYDLTPTFIAHEMI